MGLFIESRASISTCRTPFRKGFVQISFLDAQFALQYTYFLGTNYYLLIAYVKEKINS